MEATFTAVYTSDTETEWVIGHVLEYPGAVAEGTTLEEARDMLVEMVQRLLVARREQTEQELVMHEADETVITREQITVHY